MKYEVIEPIMLGGIVSGPEGPVFFDPGDVVEILRPADGEGDVLARRDTNTLYQYISSASLAPLG